MVARSVAPKARHHKGNLCSTKRTSEHAWSFPKTDWDSKKGKIFCGPMKFRLNRVGSLHSTKYGIKRSLHTNMKTFSQWLNKVEGALWFGTVLTSSRTGRLKIMEGKMNSQRIWHVNVKVATHQLGLGDDFRTMTLSSFSDLFCVP